MSPIAHPALLSIRRVLPDRPRPEERCGLCASPIDPDWHRHVVQLEPRGLQCACQACHLLFTSPGAGGGRWRAVPDRWAPVALDPAVWEVLDVPVGVAFFVVDSRAGVVRAGYPGPAGVTESSVPLERWREVVEAHPALGSVEPDVEAVLVRSTHGRPEAYVVPLDACYGLAGRLRNRWEGLAGGPGGSTVLDDLFADVEARATRSSSR